MLLIFIAALMVSLLSFVTESDSVAQECSEGSVVSDNGVSCELDVSSTDAICPEGQELDSAGLFCEAIDKGSPAGLCPEGQELDAAGLLCVGIVVESGSICPEGQELGTAGLMCVEREFEEGEEPPASICDSGYSLGRDSKTCIADGPSCDRDEVPNDAGECLKTFQCSQGLILASDLLSCISDRCPDGELLSVDGKRCVAPGSDCPDGSPRPLGGACLVVETVEGEDGETQVVVRCAEADSFCQARIKQCSDERAAGSSDPGIECADPRGACDDADEACAESNDRLVECATRDEEARAVNPLLLEEPMTPAPISVQRCIDWTHLANVPSSLTPDIPA